MNIKSAVKILFAGLMMMGAGGFVNAASFTPLSGRLYFGYTGSDVVNLQTFLASDSSIYPEGLITGYYGQLTTNAVARLQSRYGISPVGWVGPQTLAEINSLISQKNGVAVKNNFLKNSSSVSITSVSPASGPVGTVVNIYGSGFTATGNDIHFERGGVKNASSFGNGARLTFTIPKGVSQCDFIGPKCLGATRLLTSGNYSIYVTNANGQSNGVNFEVTEKQNVLNSQQPWLCLSNALQNRQNAISLDDVVDTKVVGYIAVPSTYNVQKVTVKQKLEELKATCNRAGNLVDSYGTKIYFYHLIGCWGAAPNDYFNSILQNQANNLIRLKQEYDVVEMTCNPSGLPIP